MIALLSPFFDTWQSVHILVSVVPGRKPSRKFGSVGCGPPRTVCGTFVLKAMPLMPSAEIVCCCT